jgi:hypothetical protein
MLAYVVKCIDGETDSRLIEDPAAIFFDIFRRLLVTSVWFVTVTGIVKLSEALSLLLPL